MSWDGFHILQPSGTPRLWDRCVYVGLATRHVTKGTSREHLAFALTAEFVQRKPKPKAEARHYLADFGDQPFSQFAADLAAFAKPGKPVIVWFLNPRAEVMSTALVPSLLAEGFTAQTVGEYGHTYILPFRAETNSPKHPRKITICSVANHYPGTLAELATRVGLAEPSGTGQAIASGTAAILRQTIEGHIAMVVENGLGSTALTRAGQALNAFRAKYLKKDTLHIHKNPHALRLERAANYGGRCEPFYVGPVPGKVYKLDVNAMYPSVMASEAYPVKLWTRRTRRITLPFLTRIIDEGYLITLECTIETDTPLYPYTDPHSKRTTYPTGTFRTVLCTPEVRESITRGHLRECHEVSVYYSARIFAEYSQDMYASRIAAKQDGDALRAALYKNMGAALYGKFSQWAHDWEYKREAHPDIVQLGYVRNPETGLMTEYRVFGGGVFERNPIPQEAVNAFPGISAHVTSYARVKLWRLVELAGRENVYYVDTDCLMVSEEGKARIVAAGLIDGEALGALKEEGSSSRVIIYANKDYRFGGKLVVKGVATDSKDWAIDDEKNKASGWINPSLAAMIADGNISQYKNKMITRNLHSLGRDHGWQQAREMAAD